MARNAASTTVDAVAAGELDIVIVGAGLSGIDAAYRLQTVAIRH